MLKLDKKQQQIIKILDTVLVFYELNAINPFKKIFIDQYNFAAQNYAVK